MMLVPTLRGDEVTEEVAINKHLHGKQAVHKLLTVFRRRKSSEYSQDS